MGGRIDYCVDSICELTNYLHFCPQKREHYEACTCAFSVSLPTIFISVLFVIRLLNFYYLVYAPIKIGTEAGAVDSIVFIPSIILLYNELSQYIGKIKSVAQ